MARSRITEDQVLDYDFVSHEEHSNPIIVEHLFVNNSDVPTTFSGSAGKTLKVNSEETGIEFVDIQEHVFGTEYCIARSEAESSTSSTSMITKLTLNINDIPAGDYKIVWYYEWKRSTTINDFIAEIQADSTYIAMEHSEQTRSTSSWHVASGFDVISFESGDHYVDLSYCGGSRLFTSYIRRARLEAWRVS